VGGEGLDKLHVHSISAFEGKDISALLSSHESLGLWVDTDPCVCAYARMCVCMHVCVCVCTTLICVCACPYLSACNGMLVSTGAIACLRVEGMRRSDSLRLSLSLCGLHESART
jgi:hypothetical protein